MTTPGQKAQALAKDANGVVDEEIYERELKREMAGRSKRLRSDARASYRAMQGWHTVRSQEEWEDTLEQTKEDIISGQFLIDRLGGNRYVDPIMTAALQALRTQLIDDHDASTAAELMLIDSAVMSFNLQLTVNGWIGDLKAELENEFFGRRPLSSKLKDQYGTGEVRGLRVEDIVEQLTQKLVPIFERMNRMMLRNLAALKTWRQPPAPTVSVERAGQVNVGKQQVNVTKSDDSNSLSD